MDELKVLELGLKFAPDKDPYKFDIFIDFQIFMRKVNIKKPFSRVTPQMGQESSEYSHTNLRNSSVFNPRNRNSLFFRGFWISCPTGLGGSVY